MRGDDDEEQLEQLGLVERGGRRFLDVMPE
jgi:hypothetical protein